MSEAKQERKNLQDTHSVGAGYILWILGFVGLHRFYFGKPWTGLLWLLTFGLAGIGWLVDLLLIPSMQNEAKYRFHHGNLSYQIAWALFVLGGVIGVHRFYMQKWGTAIIYLLTGGIFGLGVIYDLLTLNDQVSILNLKQKKR